MEKEIDMLKDLQHERIVVYHGAERSKTSVKIFMEYMPGVSYTSVVIRCLLPQMTCKTVVTESANTQHYCTFILIAKYLKSSSYPKCSGRVSPLDAKYFYSYSPAK